MPSISRGCLILALAFAAGLAGPAEAQLPPPTGPDLVRGFYRPTGGNLNIVNSTGSFVFLVWTGERAKLDSLFMGFRVRRTITGVSLHPLEVVGQYKTRDRVTSLCFSRQMPCNPSQFFFNPGGLFFKGFEENAIRDGAGNPTGRFFVDYPPGSPQDRCDSCYVFADIAVMSGFQTQYAVVSIDTLHLTGTDFTESPILPGNTVSLLPATPPASNLEQVAVVPNPYKGSAEWDPSSGGHRVHFIHLEAGTTVKIYTTSSELIRTLKLDANSSPGGVTGELAWDLKNEAGRTVVSGIYMYLAETPEGRTHRGHFVIIK